MECLDPESVAAVVRGRLGADRRPAVETHLSRCGFCRVSIGAGFDLLPSSTANRPALRLLKWGGAAAACLLAVLLAGRYAPGGRPQPVSSKDAPPTWTLSGPLSTGPSETRSVSLPDDTRLELGGGTRLLPRARESGERWHLELQAGQIDVQAASGAGTACITSPAGEIWILGTRFRAKAFRVRGARGSIETLAVELSEGKIQLHNSSGNLTLLPPSRGIVLSGQAPVRQEISLDREKALRELAKAQDSSGVSPDAAVLAAALWIGGPGGALTWERLREESPSPDLRAGAAALLKLCAPEDGEE